MSLSPAAHSSPLPAQGIHGQVVRLSGNHMPGVGPSSGSREPVQTCLWIFSGSIPAAGNPYWALSEARNHPALVTQVASDADGRYSVSLPPGEYTVLAEYDDSLYLNQFSGSGHFATVTVHPSQVSELNLHNTEAAYF
ncbi:MAG TPA: carboxypeptidase-like regulatory domain-containing protein [Trichocoleus sp.]